MNVFDFAMKMEEESCAYYEKLADATAAKELKVIFNLLAESEREHHEHLTILKTATEPGLAQSVVLDRALEHIADIVGKLDPADVLLTDHDAYRHVMRQEETSIRLYETLAEQEPNSAAADILRRIAGEEQDHRAMMENIYDFVESPRTFLAWGEFGNLRPY